MIDVLKTYYDRNVYIVLWNERNIIQPILSFTNLKNKNSLKIFQFYIETLKFWSFY